MSNTYRHSQVFASLKGITESIPENLTSYQYLSVLDHFLYKAMQPLVKNTKFVDAFLAQILGWQTQNPKRKTSGAGRQSFSANATLFFLVDDPKQKLKVLRGMRLDRSILFETIRRWLGQIPDYEELSSQIATPERMAKLEALRSQASMKESASLHVTYVQVYTNYKEAAAFKEKILEKYTRLCVTTAQRDYVQLGHREPLDDIIQVYIMTAMKAIDKCDTERGVLTTHIQNWLLSAKNIVVGSNVQEAAKRLAKSQGKNFDNPGEPVSIDDVHDIPAETSDFYEREDIIASVRDVSKMFDPSGVGRILMGIQETLSEEDKNTLRALSVPSEITRT